MELEGTGSGGDPSAYPPMVFPVASLRGSLFWDASPNCIVPVSPNVQSQGDEVKEQLTVSW